MNSIELDFVLDNSFTFEGQPTTREAILGTITQYGLTYEILQEHGPAGGNPLLRLNGTRENLEKYLLDQYVYDKQDYEFYSGMIQ